MKKIILLSFALIGILTLSVAQTAEKTETVKAATNTKGAKIEFESKTIDYGTIENGADGNREFKFTNTGDTPLVITNAKGSCGCTVPTWPRTPIAPGESDVIKVRYATNRTGGFSKTVTLTTNAVNSATVRLRIKGTVKPKVEETKETETKEEVH
ncbi:DUF1573 domain-containing protein [Mesoflavibacter zeaxanthinifaciens]|uniref:DUF1573 domain-containing protein n=1 Tax=Mesoflavibacter zeaxanthinifaciens TaxID=393060 RepID=UPI0004088462|nr:DUF1573 domain-containing protein [Mesoflavibacter zeaxanthinifaciens]